MFLSFQPFLSYSSNQVSKDDLKEERTPLLDLDDVDQFESELAACFDAPPPPPLNIRVSGFCSASFASFFSGNFFGPVLSIGV